MTPAACVREEVAGLSVPTLRRKEQREPRVLGEGAGAGRAGWLSDGHGAGLVLTTIGPGESVRRKEFHRVQVLLGWRRSTLPVTVVAGTPPIEGCRRNRLPEKRMWGLPPQPLPLPSLSRCGGVSEAAAGVCVAGGLYRPHCPPSAAFPPAPHGGGEQLSCPLRVPGPEPCDKDKLSQGEGDGFPRETPRGVSYCQGLSSDLDIISGGKEGEASGGGSGTVDGPREQLGGVMDSVTIRLVVPSGLLP